MSRQLDLLAQSPPQQPDAAEMGAVVRQQRADITFAAQASGTTITLFRLPKGAMLISIHCIASATHGASATIAIGVAGATARFRVAATLTTLGISLVNTAAAQSGASVPGVVIPFAEETDVILTTATASLPGSGTATYICQYSTSS